MNPGLLTLSSWLLIPCLIATGTGSDANVCAPRKAIVRGDATNTGDPRTNRTTLRVLLLSIPAHGPFNPMLALGEELVRRGHSVTLFIPNDESFTRKVGEKVAQAGVTLLSEGVSAFGSLQNTLNSEGDVHGPTQFMDFMFTMANEVEVTIKFLDTYLRTNPVDIIVGHDEIQTSLGCANSFVTIPMVSFSTTLLLKPYTYPSWPWPGLASRASSENLSFVQRLLNLFWHSIMINVVMKNIASLFLLKSIRQYCPNTEIQFLVFPGSVYLPHIIQSAIGFEYARPVSPLATYVGPVLTRFIPPIPTDLHSWLNEKGDKSVVYISMGSILEVTPQRAAAFISGISKTNYSAVWALKNKAVLKDYNIDPSKLFVIEWAPQLSILSHRATGVAILHGGINGLNEALYNEVPVIVIPSFGDQEVLAGRVHHHKYGIHLPTINLSASSLSDSINKIRKKEYTQSLKRLKKIFVQAGGVERAADLVEHYEEVGYDHLVPAYAKYNWSWVQYYNVDVYLLLCALLTFFLCASISCCRCAYRRCCTCLAHKKEKSE